MASDSVEKSAYFQGNSVELKIKICIRMNVYYKLVNECAFDDGYSNGRCSSQTKKYFFSVFI